MYLRMGYEPVVGSIGFGGTWWIDLCNDEGTPVVFTNEAHKPCKRKLRKIKRELIRKFEESELHMWTSSL